MNFGNQSHDPHGVQRLLDILRRQQDSSSSSPSSSSSAAPPAANPFAPSSIATTSTETSTTSSYDASDAARRRRTYNNNAGFNKFGIAANTDQAFDPYSFNPFSASNPVVTAPIPTPAPISAPEPAATTKDLRELSFAESLPILSTLLSDKALLRRLKALRSEQHQLEKRLVKEYTQFAAIKDRQYPNPKMRAHEDEKRRKEMLKQWDDAVARQQQELERAGVPGFKVTKDGKAADKQKKILAVLIDMADEAE